MPIDRKAYRADKKKYKSTVRTNKKNEKSDIKSNKAAEKDLNKRMKKDAKASKKSGHTPKRSYSLASRATRMLNPGDKPKRSDYKGSRPQRATGSSASKERMKSMYARVMQPLPTPIIKPITMKGQLPNRR